MNHLDTFSGIGGWALAARWMGWNTLAFVEKDKFCTKVLNKNFPGVPVHDDIFTFSGKPFRGRVDVLTGSTPCQPFSAAGKREGSNDERHLFPEFLRVVAEVEPRWIVIENVYGLLSIESGQVFEDYHSCLESEGYSVQTICIPASALGAPHRRDRLWIVAHTNGLGERSGRREVQSANGEISERDNDAEFGNSDKHDVTNANGQRPRYKSKDEHERQSQFTNGIDAFYSVSESAQICNSQTVGSTDGETEAERRTDILDTSTHPGSDDSDAANARATRWNGIERNDAVPSGRGTHQPGRRERIDGTEYDSDPDSDRLQGLRHERDGTRPAGLYSGQDAGWRTKWTEVAAEFCRVDDVVPDRVDRLKSLGNSIVPQIAFEIFKAIEATEKEGMTSEIKAAAP